MSSWDVHKNPRHFVDAEWEQTPGWCTVEKRDWIREMVAGCKGDAVDIGIWGGRSTFAISSGLPEDRIVWAIDPYSPAAGIVEHSGVPDPEFFAASWNTVENYTDVRIHWLKRLVRSGLLPKIRMLEITEEKASILFKDESLCFVHVDGNHGEVSQRDAVVRWFKKLSPGGVLCQDDTDWPSVLAAAVPAADKLGERIKEGEGKKWMGWRKR
jgi:hypothetical protein